MRSTSTNFQVKNPQLGSNPLPTGCHLPPTAQKLRQYQAGPRRVALAWNPSTYWGTLLHTNVYIYIYIYTRLSIYSNKNINLINRLVWHKLHKSTKIPSFWPLNFKCLSKPHTGWFCHAISGISLALAAPIHWAPFDQRAPGAWSFWIWKSPNKLEDFYIGASENYKKKIVKKLASFFSTWLWNICIILVDPFVYDFLLDDFQSFGGSTYDFRCLIRLLLCLHVITLTSRDTGVGLLVTSQAPAFLKTSCSCKPQTVCRVSRVFKLYIHQPTWCFLPPKNKKHTTTTIPW